MRENRTSGSVAGAPGDRSPYAGDKNQEAKMSMSERAGDVAKDVCDVVSREFGDWCKAVTKEVLDFPCRPDLKFDRDGDLQGIGIKCKFNTDTVKANIDKVLDWIDKHVETVEGEKITRNMIEGVFKDKGVSVDTDKILIRHGRPSIEPESRFRATNDFSGSAGFRAGFPNFHQADHGQGIVHGTVLLQKSAVIARDIPADSLGNPTDFGSRFRAVNDYAVRNGFVAGFPNFHQADHGSGVVYGVILLKQGTAEWRDVSASALGNPRDIGQRFRAANDYAVRNGFRAAFPNFHQADRGSGIVYGTFFLKSDVATTKDVTLPVLFPKELDVEVIEREPSKPEPEPWDARDKPWH
jgi:hypothetical protein